MFSFRELAGALRFVFSMQYGMLSAIWGRSSHQMFPPTEKGLDGRIVYHGPRITVVVHNISLFPAAYTSWKTNHGSSMSSTFEKTSEYTPTDSSGSLSLIQNQCTSSVKNGVKAAVAKTQARNMTLDCKRAAHTLSACASRQHLSGTDFSRASGSPQNHTGDRSNINGTEGERGTLINDTAAVQSNSALKLQQPILPTVGIRQHCSDAEQPQSFNSAIAISQSSQQLKVQGCAQSLTNQSTQRTEVHPPEHEMYASFSVPFVSRIKSILYFPHSHDEDTFAALIEVSAYVRTCSVDT